MDCKLLRPFLVWLLFCFVGVSHFYNLSYAGSLFQKDLSKRTIAVTFLDKGGAEKFLKSTEIAFLDILRKRGFKVLDRERLDELRKDALVKAWLVHEDQPTLDRIAEKYDTDVLICGFLKVSSEHGIGRYWLGTAHMEVKIGLKETGKIMGTAVSDPLGIPGYPASIGISPLSAQDTAVKRASANIFGKMGIHNVPSPVETPLEISYHRYSTFSARGVIESLAFSPDASLLAAGTGQGEILLWNIQRKRVEKILSGHRKGVNQVIFNSNGKLLASAGNDGAVRVWDISTGTAIKTFNSSSGANFTVAFHPYDENILAFSEVDYKIRIRDMFTGQSPAWPTQHKSRIHSLAFTRNGFLISTSDDLTMLFEVTEGKLSPGTILAGSTTGKTWTKKRFLASALSPASSLLALGTQQIDIDLQKGRRSDTASITIFDIERRKELTTLTSLRATGRKKKDISTLSFGPNWQFLASGSYDETVKVWDVERGKEIINIDLDSQVSSVSFSQDGLWLAAGSPNGQVAIWELK